MITYYLSVHMSIYYSVYHLHHYNCHHHHLSSIIYINLLIYLQWQHILVIIYYLLFCLSFSLCAIHLNTHIHTFYQCSYKTKSD